VLVNRSLYSFPAAGYASSENLLYRTTTSGTIGKSYLSFAERAETVISSESNPFDDEIRVICSIAT
jgi:hypothetical protein